ncbi:MAG: PIG-L family deacetylase [Myxococcota bacterium]|nr:PIG-L family deacetylase [Myxococcota bacterium]
MSCGRRVLVLAPHADDETLGVGGTLARHVADGDEVHVAVVTGHGDDPHPLWPRETWDKIRDEARRAMQVLGISHLHFREVPAALVADQPTHRLNKVVGELVAAIQPEILYVPFLYDLHKDHREIFHAASVAWRTSGEVGRGIKAVYCYEVQSETHWNAPYLEAGFLPNVWVDISAHLETKMRALRCYESQLRPAPDSRSVEAVRALAVWRGSQQNLAAAEAFVLIRMLR